MLAGLFGSSESEKWRKKISCKFTSSIEHAFTRGGVGPVWICSEIRDRHEMMKMGG